MNLRDLSLRICALLRPNRVERELDEELAFHIERETRKHVANGLSSAEARTRARARFGSVLSAADRCRDARGTAFVDALVRDISYAFRTFRRAPLAAFTIVATVASALGWLRRCSRCTAPSMGAYILQIVFWVTAILGGLALALTASGVFSVLSYLVEERAKDIGVRMALGATMKDIAVLVLSQSVGPVGVGLLAGGGLAGGLAIVLMATAASEIGNTVRVLDPIAYAASLLVIVTSCVAAASVPALRAARVDPMATLRTD